MFRAIATSTLIALVTTQAGIADDSIGGSAVQQARLKALEKLGGSPTQQHRLHSLTTKKRKVLAGQSTFALAVAPIPPYLLSHQVTAHSLKTDATQKLTAGGITIVPQPPQRQLGQHMETTPTVATLYIRLKSGPSPGANTAAYTIQLSLLDAWKSKSGSHKVLVSVWDATDIGKIQPNMKAQVLTALEHQLNAFLKDWKKANKSP